MAVVQGALQVATFRPSSNNRFISRCTITGPEDSACVLYVGQMNSIGQRDSSSQGAGDTAEYPGGLYVPAGSIVYLAWSINAPSASGTIQWTSA